MEFAMHGYRFTLPYQVRISDINYGGHLANSAVLDLFQEGRIAYLQNLGDYSEMDIGGGCGIILPEAHVFYRAEMFHSDALQIGVRATQLSRSSLTLEYRIERSGQVTADGTTVLVCFDYAKHKPRRLATAFRDRVLAFEDLKKD
jgi:acyl-CoA thioester hydrolase